jgi:DNA-directed RNA polymerase subunit RPC12/RpoP
MISLESLPLAILVIILPLKCQCYSRGLTTMFHLAILNGMLRWKCLDCGTVSSEGELNNKLRCPRCGSHRLVPKLEEKKGKELSAATCR